MPPAVRGTIALFMHAINKQRWCQGELEDGALLMNVRVAPTDADIELGIRSEAAVQKRETFSRISATS
jgi:hypothetical protein